MYVHLYVPVKANVFSMSEVYRSDLFLRTLTNINKITISGSQTIHILLPHILRTSFVHPRFIFLNVDTHQTQYLIFIYSD